MKLSIQLKPKDTQNYYVYICIFHNRERVLIATEYIISAKYVKNGKITNVSKQAEIYNNSLLKYQSLIDQIPAVDVLTAKAIKEIITSNKVDRSNDLIDFFAFSDSYIADLEDMERRGTAAAYKSSLAVFRKYIGREALYTFEMTSALIQQFIKSLILEGKAAKSINVYITHLKVLFNACRDAHNDYDLGILNIRNYPFKKLSLPRVDNKAGRKAVSVGDMQRLILGKDVPEDAVFARDIFLLSFYLLGMNMVDMYHLQKQDYQQGHIIYNRQKTIRREGGSQICIPVCPQATDIIDKYKGKGNNLLNFADRYKDAKSVNSALSERVKPLYNWLKPAIEKEYFTMYSARHTWASIAANECHFSDAEVARALNHQSEHKVTRGYIRPDWSLLDRMNNAVLSVVFQTSVID